MKNVILGIALISGFFCQAQEESENISELYRHEISVNALDLVVAGSIEVQYEHFLPQNQALQFNVSLFDNYAYFDVDDIKNNSTHSVAGAYRFYIAKKEYAGLFFYPYAKYMFGKQDITDYWEYNEENYENITKEIDMNNFSLGFGLGYKWVFGQKYSLGIDAAFGRTFSDEMQEEFSRVESKFGINFGVRF